MSVFRPSVWLFNSLVAFRKLPTYFRRARKKAFGKPNYFAKSAPKAIPKKIWIFWDKGEADAPDLVKFCIASWRAQNPEWEISVLDATSAESAVDLPHAYGTIPVQSFADLLRLRLLKKQGGVWVDATTFCLYPLDDWLPFAAQRGFFAFTWMRNDFWFLWPGIRRSVTNWFIAAEPESVFLTQWEKASMKYWEGRKRPSNYYWPHVLVDYLYLTSRSFRKAYQEVPKISCFGPHLVHDAVTQQKNQDAAAAALRSGTMPVQKLRWNWPEARAEEAKALILANLPPQHRR